LLCAAGNAAADANNFRTCLRSMNVFPRTSRLAPHEMRSQR
jgi:hypothetical protein